MRVKKTKNCFNETKYLILHTIFNADRYLTPLEIARTCGLTLQAVKSALTRLYRWRYIWRSADGRKTQNWYCYGHLKPKGVRILKEFQYRKRLNISLNLKKARSVR